MSKHARIFVDICDEDEKIILSCKNSILFHNGKMWEKVTDCDFDVTMGSYDCAEVCELVGLYLLSLINTLQNLQNLQNLHNFHFNGGLYRDDGLFVIKLTDRQSKQIKQELRNIFHDNDLDITIEVNSKVVNFLDVTLDLQKLEFRPLMKPNNTPLYIHTKSNHPPGIIKNVPKSVNTRLSTLSSHEENFNNAKQIYQRALNESGHDFELKFQPNIQMNNNRKNRQRKCIFFNPPY